MLIQNIATKPEKKKNDDGKTIRLILPLKDQIAGS